MAISASSTMFLEISFWPSTISMIMAITLRSYDYHSVVVIKLDGSFCFC